MKIQRYGWVRDLPDHRDFIDSTPLETPQPRHRALTCVPRVRRSTSKGS